VLLLRTVGHGCEGSGRVEGRGTVVRQPEVSFAGLVRQLRAAAGLTQEELAQAAGLPVRTLSDLERGVSRTAHKDTAGLLAQALGLAGPVRELFVAAARGKAPADDVLAAARQGVAPGPFAAVATRALPRDIAAFTGRQADLSQLLEALAAAAAGGGVAGIHAIDGMAGVGKTTFAVHAAHRLTGTFPDGQFFLPLHAHTPGRSPVDPADALASLLLTAGVAPAAIPPGTEARAGRWRDWVSGRKILLLLDDAAGYEQVRPLLPGTAGSLVLVTSRRRLAALDDATVISLDILPPAEAAALLARLAARPGLRAGDAAVAEITRLCGYLPLAIGMIASQLRHHPARTTGQLAADLAQARDRLAVMRAENLSVVAAFDLSYADLTEDQQRLFRHLGLVPGPSLDAYAAAALHHTSLDHADRLLDDLYDQHLLTEPAPGRYRMHDLIRAYARALADRLDPDGDRDQASARLLDYYQHAAALADGLLARQPRISISPAAGTRPAAVPALADREQALAWVRAERASLLGCLDHATGTGQHARIIALTTGLAGLLRHDGPWAEALTRHATALRAARHLGDRPGQARALTDLAHVRWLTDDNPGAARDLEKALGICRELGDRLGQANALAILGYVWRATGDYPAAVRDLEEALGICRDLGERRGQGNALVFLGDVRRRAGDYAGAARDLEEALGLCRDLGDKRGRANALAFLGDVRRVTGDYPGAARDLEEALGLYRDIDDPGGQVEALNVAGALHRAGGDLRQAGSCHQQALVLARQIGSAWDEAHALAGLGRCAVAARHVAGPQDKLRQALEIFQRIGAAEAAEVSTELQALADRRSAAIKA
jgi:tetratricopeptide (TPR) repeat protein/transcriptional regulator with XRE-family HTH domain